MFITIQTSRTELENAALLDCGFSVEAIEAATDAELYEMIQAWIEAGDECAAA